MLIQRLAQDPTTAPQVLRRFHELALAQRQHRGVRGHEPDLRLSLAKNPATSVTAVRELLHDATHADYRAALLRCALSRPGLSATDALRILEGDTTTTSLTAALDHVDDPDATLARAAYAATASTTIWDRLVTGPHTPPELRFAAAEHIVAEARERHVATSIQRHVAELARKRVAHAHGDDQRATAAAWVKCLQDLTTAKDFAKRLARMPTGPAAPGTAHWMSDPTTTTQDVLAHITGRPRALWVRALANHREGAATLATHAMAAWGESEVLAQDILELAHQQTLPASALAAALRALTASVSREQMTALTAPANSAAYAGLRTRVRQLERFFWEVAARPDLTPADLDVLHLCAQLIIAMPMNDFVRGATFSEALWCLMFATHPGATPLQRRDALECAREADPRTFAHSRGAALDLATLTQACAHLDPTDPALTARAGEALSVERLLRTNWDRYTGVGWLVDAGIKAHLPADTSGTVADVLLSLTPTFPGTVRELLTVSACVLT